MVLELQTLASPVGTIQSRASPGIHVPPRPKDTSQSSFQDVITPRGGGTTVKLRKCPILLQVNVFFLTQTIPTNV